MFVRAKLNSSKKSKYIQIVKSYRGEDGKSRQSVIKHIGSALVDDIDKINELKNIGKHLINELNSLSEEELSQFKSKNLNLKHPWEYPIKGKLFAINPHDKSYNYYTEVINNVNVGYHDIIGKVYDEIGFNTLFDNIEDDKKERCNLILRNLVIARIANPSSKRAATFFMKNHFDIDIDLNCIYRLMDMINEDMIKKIQKKAYESALLHQKEDVVIGFYDVTTLYFESFIEDDFKSNGFSKDGKFNQPQILFGLLSTKEGLPICYKVFKGSTFEGHTLVEILKDIKKEYCLRRITVVADAGMLNKSNIEYLEENNYKYIVGGKIKVTSSKVQEKILNKRGYKLVSPKSEFSYKKIKEGNQNIIITYSPKRARKDAYDREKAILKLKNKLEKGSCTKSILPQRAYNKYLKFENTGQVELNEEKIRESSLWDGLHGIRTNISENELKVGDLLERYRDLWRVEESFRITKHDLSIRPIFHWTSRRIESHIAVVFMSFTCIKRIMHKLEKSNKGMSCRKIVDLLKEVVGTIKIDRKTGKRYYLPSQISPETETIYKLFKKRPKKKMMLLKV